MNVSRIICTWGYDDAFQYGELSDGVGRVRDFIHSERYNYDGAVVNASKAAYLALVKFIWHLPLLIIKQLALPIVPQPFLLCLGRIFNTRKR